MPTTPRGIWTPDSTDDYDLVVDLAATANSIDGALDNLSESSNVRVGTAAQRASFLASAPVGSLWQDTDGIRMIWRKDGSAWVPAVWSWGGSTSQMNTFSPPDGFRWHNTTTGTLFTRQSGTWFGGKIDLSSYLLSGWSGQVSARIQGQMVDISGTVTGVAVPSQSGVTNLAAGVPASIAPADDNRWGPTYTNGYIGGAVIRPDGTMSFANRTGGGGLPPTVHSLPSLTRCSKKGGSNLITIFRKFKNPKLNPNIKPSVNYWRGWCHSNVRLGFGAPSNYGSAYEAWTKAKRRHKNRKFPKADVPLFFSLRGVPAGHVVVRKANGTIITTGLNDTTKTFSSLDALLRAWPALHYLGWAEDINKTDIIKIDKKKPVEPPAGKENEMYIIRCEEAWGPKSGTKNRAWAIVGPGFWYETAIKKEVVNFKSQWGNRVNTITVKKSTWDQHKKSAQAGMVTVQGGVNKG